MKRFGECAGFAVTVALLAPPALACSCDSIRSAAEQFEKAAAVFEGRVIRIEDADRSWQARRRSLLSYLYTKLDVEYPVWLREDLKQYGQGPRYGRDVEFDVAGYWKGLPLRRLTVRTGFGGGDCGYPFEYGRRYRVYAFVESRPPLPSPPPVAHVEFLATHICTRTAESFSARTDDLPPAPFRATVP